MRKEIKSMIAMGMVCTMLVVVLSGCGKEAEPVMNQQGGAMETNVASDSRTPLESKDIDSTSPEVVGDNTNEDVNDNEEKASDTFEGAEDDNIELYRSSLVKELRKDYEGLEELEFEKNEVTIVINREDAILYNGNGEEVGYVKKDGTVNIVESTPNSKWARFVNPLPEAGYDYLYLEKIYLKANGAGTSTTASVTKETPKTETPEINVSVEESTSIPTQAEPVVEENTKYTPEEAIEIYKNTIIDGGMTWDPSIKEFASWGTGLISRSDPISVAQAELEGMIFANDTRYYFEVTNSDENYVYITVWGCD